MNRLFRSVGLLGAAGTLRLGAAGVSRPIPLRAKAGHNPDGAGRFGHTASSGRLLKRTA